MRTYLMACLAAVLAACGSQDGATPAGKVAALPLAKVVATVELKNAGFEDAAGPGGLPGWTLSQHAGVHAYEATRDTQTPFAGAASLRLHRVHEQVFGSISQDVSVGAWAGRMLELSAMARTDQVGPEGWMLSVDGPGLREMSPALSGTTGWQPMRVRIQLPAGIQKITIGAILLDAGSGWLDDVRLDVIE